LALRAGCCVSSRFPGSLAPLRSTLSVLAAAAAIFPLAAEVRAQVGARREEVRPPAQKAPKLTAPPVLLQAAAPEYPPEAAAAGVGAEVKVRLHIDARGVVTSVDVLEPVGAGFDEAAVAAALQYRFKPAEFDGRPGPIAVETSIHFVMEEVRQPEALPPPSPEQRASAVGHGGDPAQPITLDGVAKQRGTRKRLAGVIISVLPPGIDAVSDADGRFFFHGLPPGDYQIRAEAEGYAPFSRSLHIGAGQKASAELYLRARGGNPYSTVVEGERDRLEVTVHTIQREQIQTVPGTFGDPIRVVQTLPGLARSPFLTGFLIVRGSNPQDSGVYVDGHRIPQLFHFLGGPSILNAEFLEKVDLYPGGFPTRFGRNTGGVVDVESRPTKSDGWHGSGEVDFLNAGGYFRAPIGKNGSFAIAGRRSYFDEVLPLVLPRQRPGRRLLVVPVYFDYQARLDWNFENQGKASVFAFGSGDRLDVLSTDSDAERFFNLDSSIDFFRIIGHYERPAPHNLTLTLSPAYGRDSVVLETGGADGGPSFASFGAMQDVLGYRMRLAGRVVPNVHLDTGLDIEARNTHYKAALPINLDVRRQQGQNVQPELVKRSADQLAYGFYSELGIDIERFRLIPGVRFDGYVLGGKNRFSLDPRLVVRYRFSEEWVGKAYAGLFHQPPQPEQFDETFGNPKIGLERALHTGLGAEWKFAPQWSADGEVYFVGRQNLIHFTNDAVVNADGTVTPIVFENTGVGDTFGFELLVKREVTRNLYGWLSYTLSTSRQRPTPDDVYRPTLFDQTHVLNAVLSYKIDAGWEFGGRYRLATGNPQTDVIGSTFDADKGSYVQVKGPPLGGRARTFNQLDVRVEKTWVYETWMLGVYLDVLNVFNIDNQEAIQYDYRYLKSQSVSSVPIIPTLGLRGQF
jgi:TonB family protein